jgi:hypothetical protein
MKGKAMREALANQDIDREVESPLTRERLHAIQGSVNDLDLEIMRHKEMVQRRQGIVEASKHIANRLFQEHGPLDQELEGADEGEVAIIRAKKETVTKLTDIVRSIAVENASDAVGLQNKLAGIEFAGQVLAKRFEREVANYERGKELGTDEDGVDELGRSPEDRAALAAAHGGNGGLDPRDSNVSLDPATLAERKAAKAREAKAEADAKAEAEAEAKEARVAKKKRANKTK